MVLNYTPSYKNNLLYQHISFANEINLTVIALRLQKYYVLDRINLFYLLVINVIYDIFYSHLLQELLVLFKSLKWPNAKPLPFLENFVGLIPMENLYVLVVVPWNIMIYLLVMFGNVKPVKNNNPLLLKLYSLVINSL